EELTRMRRVSDMMVSCHATLRDRYSSRATALDLLVLICSVWLTAMAFVDPKIADILSPNDLSPQLLIGLLAVATFALTLVQLQVGWRTASAAHGQAARAYSVLKLQLATLLNSEAPGAQRIREMIDDYQRVGSSVIQIPDKQFT